MNGICMDECQIRRAEERDTEAIAALERLCFRTPWSGDSVRRELTENRLALYIAAELQGEVVAYAGIWLVAGEGHITNIAVHPDFRRRHIGEAVVRNLLLEAEKAGAQSQTLEVRASNEPAIKLYEKFGFRAAGVRKNYYEDNGEDALIMWRCPQETEKV